MQAIVTKVLGVTDTKPTRVKATCEAGSVTITWDGPDSHDNAMRQLVARLTWTEGGKWYKGGLPGNKGCVYVYAVPSTEVSP